MTCGEVEPLIEAFVDSELPASTLLDVARHAGQCDACDRLVQRHLTVRLALSEHAEEATAALDFDGLWAKIDAEATRIDGQRAWRERADAKRGRTPYRKTLWGSIAAVAAGVALFVGIPATRQAPVMLASNPQPGAVARPVASKRLPNHVYIDRLAGKDIAVRRERKSGTTMIWVNHEVERSGW
jgi:anti-sigma factor RsiW